MYAHASHLTTIRSPNSRWSQLLSMVKLSAKPWFDEAFSNHFFLVLTSISSALVLEMASSTVSIPAATLTKGRPHMTLAPRQDFRTITQTIRLPDTTFVTEVTLGGPPRVAGSDQTAAPTPNDRNSGGSSNLTGAELGAILGGVFGFIVLAIIIWCCLVSRRRQKQREQEEYDDEMLEFDHSSPRPQPRMPQHPRQARHPRPVFSMPVPPRPLYEVNRRPPWNPVYSGGPRRHLRR